jgi:hypothetical protein
MATRRINPKLLAAFEAASVEPFDMDSPGRIVEVPVPAEQFQQPAAAPVAPPKTRLQMVQEYLDSKRAPMGPPDFGPDVDVAAARQADARQNQAAALQDASMAFLGRSKGAPADVRTAETAALGAQAARKKAIADYYAAQDERAIDEAGVLSRAAAEPGKKDPELERERLAETKAERERRERADAADEAFRRDKMNRPPRLPAPPKNSDGKTLPASTVEGLADLPVAEAAIDEIVDSFKRLDMGGLAGKAGAFVSRMPGLGGELAPDATEYEGIAKIGMQSVGKILEGGKLAAGDELKYKAMLPKGGDSEKVVEAKRSHLKAFLRSLVAMRAKGLKESGYNVPAEFLQSTPPTARANPSETPDIRPPEGKVPMVSESSGNVIFVTPATAEAGLKAKTLRKP